MYFYFYVLHKCIADSHIVLLVNDRNAYFFHRLKIQPAGAAILLLPRKVAFLSRGIQILFVVFEIAIELLAANIYGC